MKWKEEQTKLVFDRTGEALREIGMLWFVFSLLDKLITGSLTLAWAFANFAGCSIVWAGGTYIEAWLLTWRTNTSPS